MNIFKFLFELFLFYFLYKLVFDFIIPVYRASKRMKDQVGQMQQKMQEQQRSNTPPPPKQAPPASSSKDYIDFEEIK